MPKMRCINVKDRQRFAFAVYVEYVIIKLLQTKKSPSMVSRVALKMESNGAGANTNHAKEKMKKPN